MKKFIFMMMMVVTLAGCSTAAQRQADCQAQGISKDTCYLAEQNRQNAINNAAMKQAMENANKAANP